MGMSDVVTKFLKNPSKSQKVVNMTIYDAEHYTDEQKEQIIASYPEHEREARARGIPTMGTFADCYLMLLLLLHVTVFPNPELQFVYVSTRVG